MKAERAAAAVSQQPKHAKNADDKKDADHSQQANKFTKVDDVIMQGRDSCACGRVCEIVTLSGIPADSKPFGVTDHE